MTSHTGRVNRPFHPWAILTQTTAIARLAFFGAPLKGHPVQDWSEELMSNFPIRYPGAWRFLQEMKNAGLKIVSLTAYTCQEARITAPHVDFLLVGDSVAMIKYGHGTTRAATMPMMIEHGSDVVKCAGKTPVVVDLPECAYQTKSDALKYSQTIMVETGCAAIKLEGGVEMAETIELLTEHGIPVMGHIGLLPSKYDEGQKFIISGKGQEAAERLIEDARAVERAGAFAVVLEGSIEPVARHIAKNILSIPAIGSGATPDASGQILGNRDIWAPETEWRPKFAMSFSKEGEDQEQAVLLYALAVRRGEFPDRRKQCYPYDPAKHGPLTGIELCALGRQTTGLPIQAALTCPS